MSRDLGDGCGRSAHLNIVRIPLQPEVIAVQPFWHEQFHNDPANMGLRQWLRENFRAGRCSA